MDDNSNPGATPLDDAHSAHRVATLTGMSADSAKTYMDFHSGKRWLRRDLAEPPRAGR